MENPDKPIALEEEHLEYLDKLRESGVTNMFGAGPYLVRRFRLNSIDAGEILGYWMATFSQRHPA